MNLLMGTAMVGVYWITVKLREKWVDKKAKGQKEIEIAQKVREAIREIHYGFNNEWVQKKDMWVFEYGDVRIFYTSEMHGGIKVWHGDYLIAEKRLELSPDDESAYKYYQNQKAISLYYEMFEKSSFLSKISLAVSKKESVQDANQGIEGFDIWIEKENWMRAYLESVDNIDSLSFQNENYTCIRFDEETAVQLFVEDAECEESHLHIIWPNGRFDDKEKRILKNAFIKKYHGKPVHDLLELYTKELKVYKREEAEREEAKQHMWEKWVNTYTIQSAELLKQSSLLTEEELHQLEFTYPNDLQALHSLYDKLNEESKAEMETRIEEAFHDLLEELRLLNIKVEDRKKKDVDKQLQLIRMRTRG